MAKGFDYGAFGPNEANEQRAGRYRNSIPASFLSYENRKPDPYLNIDDANYSIERELEGEESFFFHRESNIFLLLILFFFTNICEK